MRRRRIETIKAENYEDYLAQLNKIDEEYSKKEKEKEKKVYLINEDDDDDYFSLNYKMEKEISLEEREKIDEDNLIKNINLIKEEIQNSPLSISSFKTLDSDKNLKKFYLENFENFQEKLKIVVIGKKKSGKTFFIENFENYNNNNNKENKNNFFNKNCYEPTISLEFKNKIFNNVKIEFIDTNENIINDCIIKTYYDLCNGIIIVSNNLNEDKNFIENQIKKINKNEKILIFENNNNNMNLFNNNDINKVNLFDLESNEKNKFYDFICKLINLKHNLNHLKNSDYFNINEIEEINLNDNNNNNISNKLISLLNEINIEKNNNNKN